MNEDISRSVILACVDLGLEPRSYSGRGMYGESCVGVDGRNTHVILAQIIVALCEQGPDGLEAALHVARDGAIASDSMGLGGIVYFPSLPWTGREDDLACSTCGCLPGEGRTEGCEDEDGCGRSE